MADTPVNGPQRQRALAEAMAFGDAAGVRPADRLKALELLRELDAIEPDGMQTARELAGMPDHALQREVDALVAGLVGEILVGDRDGFPRTLKIIRDEAERLAHVQRDGWIDQNAGDPFDERPAAMAEREPVEPAPLQPAASAHPAVVESRPAAPDPAPADPDDPALKLAPPGVERQSLDRAWRW